MNYLGIDFGTSFSSIAMYNGEGVPEAIKLATAIGSNGDSFSMPSSVYFDDDDKIYIGQAADNLKRKEPTRYIREFKLNIGQKEPIILADKAFMPQDLCEILFQYFKNKGTEMQGAVDTAIVTYPANFSFYKQSIIKEVAEKVNFNKIIMLDEPTAAAIYYYSKGKIKDGEKLLVYDLGGGTFDVALIERTHTGFRPITAPLGIERCGGALFDFEIFTEIKRWLKENNKFDLDKTPANETEAFTLRRFRAELEEEAIRIKCQLSSTESTTVGITLPTFEYVEFTFTRKQFEELIHNQIMDTCLLTEKIVENAHMEMQDIDKVLFVGGSCRIPYVEKMVSQTTGLPIFRDADPELIVCYGAAVSAVKNIGKENMSVLSDTIEPQDTQRIDNIFCNAGIKEYEDYNATCNNMVDAMKKLVKATKGFEEFQPYNDAITHYVDKLNGEKFKIMILGQFKVGKSTFINSFIGEEILPSDIVPCTAVINEIKWGAKRRAVIHFKNPIPMVMSQYLAKEVRKYIEKYNYENVPPLEVEIDDLRKYVVIPEPDKTQTSATANCMPYDRIEIFWPLEICKNGVEIIDSPGLNDNETMDKVTIEYLNKADIVLFVMGCPQIGADCEMKFIDNYLTPLGHKHIMFICNRFDIIRRSDRPRLMENSKRRLGEKTVFGEEGVVFVSATNALDGKIDRDDDLIRRSGIVEVEKRLSEFLTKYRGGFRLKMAADVITENVKNMKNLVPERIAELNQDKDEILVKHSQAAAYFNELDASTQKVIDKIRHDKNALMIAVDNSVEVKFNEIIDNINQWAMDTQVETKLGIVHALDNSAVEKYANELQEMIKKRIQLTIIHHMSESIQPMLQAFLDDIDADINSAMTSLKNDLNAVLSNFSGLDAEKEEQQITFDFGANLAPNLPGFLNKVKVGGSIGVAGVAVAIVASPALLLPVSIIALPTAAIFAGVQIYKKSAAGNSLGLMEEYIRKQVAATMSKGLKKSLVYTSTQISKDIMEKLNSVISNVSNMLKSEIQMARNHVDITFKDSTMSENEINKKKIALQDIDKEITRIVAEYNEVSKKHGI